MGMGMFMATTAIIGLVLLIRPNPSVSVPAAGLLLALLAAVLHAVYIMLGRGGWGEIEGDGAATFLIVATASGRAWRTDRDDPSGDRAGAG